MTNRDALLAFLSAHPGGARYWPTPTEPDVEPLDDGDDDYPVGLDWNHPIGWTE